MKAWLVKSEIYDAQEALATVAEQRSMGRSAWIEDENGKLVEEESLKGDHVKQPTTLKDRAVGLFVILGSAAVMIVTLWAVGVWVDH